MTIVIAGNIVQKSEGLSELTRQVLSFIDGGQQWLVWAMASPTIFYEATDETALLADVQHGLHASPLTLLPGLGLSVSPVKLMSLGSEKLRALQQVESGDASAAIQLKVQRILSDSSLLDGNQLRSSSDFLQALGIATHPLFQAMDFNDRVLVYMLAATAGDQDGGIPAETRLEAAAFAVQQARTVPEFCDYYQVYQAYSKKVDALGHTAAARNLLCSQAMHTILPLAFAALDCPRMPDRLPSPDEVEKCLRDWLARGRKLGFSRLSQAVLQIVTQTTFSTETGADASRLFDLYFNAAQSFLATSIFKESLLEQDGGNLIFTLQNSAQQAVLTVSADRMLSLRTFGNATVSGAEVLLSGASVESSPEYST